MRDVAQVEHVVALRVAREQVDVALAGAPHELASGCDSMTTTRLPAAVSRFTTALPIFRRRKSRRGRAPECAAYPAAPSTARA